MNAYGLKTRSVCGNKEVKGQVGSFPFVPPVRYAPPVTEHVPLHSKSLCKNMARAFGGGGGEGVQIICTHLAGGGTNGKSPSSHKQICFNDLYETLLENRNQSNKQLGADL